VKGDSINATKEPFTKPKLAYTWDRYLAIRQVSEITPDKEDGKEGPPRLQFSLINEWIGEESIVAIQWLLQQVSPFMFLAYVGPCAAYCITTTFNP
jgi:hypothetical protein